MLSSTQRSLLELIMPLTTPVNQKLQLLMKPPIFPPHLVHVKHHNANHSPGAARVEMEAVKNEVLPGLLSS